MSQEKSRWLYRFDNYSRAFSLLREAIETSQSRPLSPLEKEGVIQRFEYTWELAWKVLKDYLQQGGIVLDVITPAAVIRAAFAANLIADGEMWMEALDTRNTLSHSYDPKLFEQTVTRIGARYLPLFEKLHADLSTKAAPYA